MTSYEIEITRAAESQLRKLERRHRSRILQAVRALADGPRPRGARKLHGFVDVFRIRVGRYRVLYEVADRRLIVMILKVGHRRDVYR